MKSAKKGLRMVWYDVKFGIRGGYWLPMNNYVLSKAELRKWLKSFKKSEFPTNDIISVKIYRCNRIGTTMTYDVECLGYTDVDENGKLYPINL